MRSWRRPLSSLCAVAADAGWLIQRLVEPRPGEELRRRFPEAHQQLSDAPGFLVLRLLRPGA